jgi:peptidoglycan/xylan/chitin deacetylase (PgdA/CDA1 family)
MTPTKANLTRLGLDVLYKSAIYRLFRPAWSGVGIIFTLHHVVPEAEQRLVGFSPNRILTISAEFLEATIAQVKANGIEIVDLNEARRRLQQQDFSTRFACFTLDDGYRDNYTIARPVFERHGVPYTVYVTSGVIDGEVNMWWEHLETIIGLEPTIDLLLAGRRFEYNTATDAEKYRAYDAVYWHMRRLPEAQQREAIELLMNFRPKEGSEEDKGFRASEPMSWDMVQEIATSELGTIGGHTVRHRALSKLTIDEVRHEVQQNLEDIEHHTGINVEHFTYPFGDPGSAAAREFELLETTGLASSTTTRKGMIFPEHAQHMHALPRVSLNGDYQKSRYVELFLSGAPFALWGRFRRLNVV